MSLVILFLFAVFVGDGIVLAPTRVKAEFSLPMGTLFVMSGGWISSGETRTKFGVKGVG